MRKTKDLRRRRGHVRTVGFHAGSRNPDSSTGGRECTEIQGLTYGPFEKPNAASPGLINKPRELVHSFSRFSVLYSTLEQLRGDIEDFL